MLPPPVKQTDEVIIFEFFDVASQARADVKSVIHLEFCAPQWGYGREACF